MVQVSQGLAATRDGDRLGMGLFDCEVFFPLNFRIFDFRIFDFRIFLDFSMGLRMDRIVLHLIRKIHLSFVCAV